MWTKALVAVGAMSVATATYIGGAPDHWYMNVPGVQGTGPLNHHFALDVALAFLASGGALIWAGLKSDRSAALCGTAWLVFHALFHLWIWLHRGAPLDVIAVTNLAGIQLPALVAFLAAFNMNQKEVSYDQASA